VKPGLKKSSARARADPPEQDERLAEDVVEIAGNRDLHGRVDGPDQGLVPELGIIDPAGEKEHLSLKLDIVARIHEVRVTQVVEGALLGRHLVEVANQQVKPHPELAQIRLGEGEAFAGRDVAPLALLELGVLSLGVRLLVPLRRPAGRRQRPEQGQQGHDGSEPGPAHC
jgi:hypothetical protein